MQGKSTVEDVGIAPHDMPNFFVEALTVADGKLHNEVREIAVPPESRIVDVAIEPVQTAYKPGQKAKVKVKLTGPDGKPFLGSSVLTVYDKAVEYISGGSNVPDIKEFFWKWKRHHQPQTESSLSRWFSNLLKPNEVGMEELSGAVGFDAALALGEVRFGAMNTRMLGAMYEIGGMGGGKFATPIADLARAAPMAKAAAPVGATRLANEVISADSFDDSAGQNPGAARQFAPTSPTPPTGLPH